MKTRRTRLTLMIAWSACLCGCTSMANMPAVQEKLKIVSAGYTGCVPEQNELSNLAPRPDGSGTWNATCKGKIWLCSTIATTSAQSYHCAPVAQ